jgi:hypothetical protein
MYSTLPELSNSGPLCHNDKKAAREWAVQARYTQARLTKGRGACSACRPAQRSLRSHGRQRRGVFAFRQRWRAEVLLIQRDQHERTGSRWVRPSQRQRETVSALHRGGDGVGANGQFEMLGGARRLGAGSIGSTQVRSRVDSEGCYKPQNRDAVRAPRGSEFAAGRARRAG